MHWMCIMHAEPPLTPTLSPLRGERGMEAERGEPPFALAPRARPSVRAEVDPVLADRWSVRITIDGAFKEEIETPRCL
jgi:hypothetical protein